ncbi:YigZ family protein [Arsenicicoccus piscis]|uniref:IMPACT family protein n=1 Tax=Arsenicicoccus piscis TaxID=673954 RepID=UPI001F4D1CC2|nr:YigZ family protein [Arsenicicoccus piscis]
MSAYRTLASPVEAEIEVRRSRFLARVERVEDEESARAVVDRARRRHHDARHHCSAFLLGDPAGPELVARSSDDGEPSGTAGAPILEVLRGRGDSAGQVGAAGTSGTTGTAGATGIATPLSDVVAVVTRWFGGTLLGTGGLVRAYGGAVRAALDQAATVQRTLVWDVVVESAVAEAGRLDNDLRSRGFAVVGVDYRGDAVLLHLGVPDDRLERLHEAVAQATAGRGAVTTGGERWVDEEPAWH